MSRPTRRCPLLVLGFLLFLGAAPAVGAQDKRLLCLGDSLTAGYGLDEDEAWPRLLQKRLDREAPGWTVVNAGDSGDTSADALGRMDWLLRNPPTAAFVCLGANDGLRGLPVEQTRRNLGRILARLRKAGVVVYLAGMDIPSNLGGATGTRSRRFFRTWPAARACPSCPSCSRESPGWPS